MIKSFLILINISILLSASQQIILVVADDFNTSKAKLECFEGSKKYFKTINVNLGKKGLGWGLGKIKLSQMSLDSQKREGDKKAPAGIFKLSSIFAYSKSNNFKMPYMHTSKNLICVDDSESIHYNKIISLSKEKPASFEWMKRDDLQYELGIVVEHNTKGVPQKGSCIFIHVQKAKDVGTAGCTSMALQDLQEIVSWLDIKKNPILIQIKRSSLKEVYKKYPQLKNTRI